MKKTEVKFPCHTPIHTDLYFFFEIGVIDYLGFLFGLGETWDSIRCLTGATQYRNAAQFEMTKSWVIESLKTPGWYNGN